MIEPRVIRLDREATLALSQILGIMLDQLFELEASQGWSTEHIIDLDARLVDSLEGESITLGIDDAALLLQGMAFTELMSVDLPWFETVQWVTDFVTSELRQHWSDQEWLTFTSLDHYLPTQRSISILIWPAKIIIINWDAESTLLAGYSSKY